MDQQMSKDFIDFSQKLMTQFMGMSMVEKILTVVVMVLIFVFAIYLIYKTFSTLHFIVYGCPNRCVNGKVTY